MFVQPRISSDLLEHRFDCRPLAFLFHRKGISFIMRVPKKFSSMVGIRESRISDTC